MGIFIRETISTSCVAGRGHPMVLWGIRGICQVIFGRLREKRVTDSKNELFRTKAPSPSMSRQCGDLLEKQFPLPVWRARAIPLCYGVLGGPFRSYLADKDEKELQTLKMDFFEQKHHYRQ